MIATLGQPNGAPTRVRSSVDGLEWSDHGTIGAEPNTSTGVLENTGLGLLFAPTAPDCARQGHRRMAVDRWCGLDGGADWRGRWVADAAESPDMVALIGSISSAEAGTRPSIWIHSTE